MKKTLLTIAAIAFLAVGADAKGVKKAHKKTAKAKPTYIVNGDGTYSKKGTTDATRPSPYKGSRVPENDGQKKNKERNLNYGNGQTPDPNAGK